VGRISNPSCKPTLEILEDRRLLSASWSGYALNAQHTAESPAASQALQAIRWQTPVDLNPQYSGNDLLIHYGSPLVTPANTVIVPVKTGATNGFEIEGLNAVNGSVLWTQTTDYILPPHDWTPSYSPVLTAQNRLYFAGAGGTVYYLDNPDSPGPHTVTHLAFYGINNYTHAGFDSSVYIDTPITADSQGDIFFGFRVTGSNPSSLTSGIAQIDANGAGIWMPAQVIAGGDTNITVVPHQAAPALSNDEKTLYVVVASTGNWGYGYLVALNATTLAVQSSGTATERVRLKDPRNGGTTDASMLDDSSASPMVGPDGDVYYGVMGNPYNGSRGWMLHFSSDLLTEKTPGAFGWDDTASVVPAAMVPSYTGTSSYLIFTKFNNYAGITDGGDGVNKIAVLDPNATEVEPHVSSNGLLVMKEILTMGGTLGNDTIAITPVANGGVMVGMNYVNYGSFFPTGHVVVYSQSGNDIIKTAAQTLSGTLTYVTVPVMFFAGNGNDVLNVTGSSANNVLVGGGGTDRLLGGQGRDILIGGSGQATLNAGSGGDILIGGTTDYDNNAAALAAVLAEWSRTDIDYTTRIAHLNGSMSGGLNGSYLLNTGTVHGNGLADNLYGGPGMDWYFAGIMDVISNKTAGEMVVTPI
jgi:Ca2+-binding RTX toxin-like protein